MPKGQPATMAARNICGNRQAQADTPTAVGIARFSQPGKRGHRRLTLVLRNTGAIVFDHKTDRPRLVTQGQPHPRSMAQCIGDKVLNRPLDSLRA